MKIAMIGHKRIPGREGGIEVVVVSIGGDGALLVSKEGIYQGRPPKILK